MNQLVSRVALQPGPVRGASAARLAQGPLAQVPLVQGPLVQGPLVQGPLVQGPPAQDCARARRVPVDCGDLPFLIRRDGGWLYRGSPIRRKEMVCLFASVLQRAEDGEYWLETPAERGRIEVEDVPFLAVEMDWTGCGHRQCLSFRTNVDQLVTADREHPIRIAHDLLTCDPTPYIRVRAGAGRHAIEARITRAVYYELVALAEPMPWQGRQCLGVWSCGTFFPLGDAPACDDEGSQANG